MRNRMPWLLLVPSVLFGIISIAADETPSKKLTMIQITEMLNQPCSNLTGSTASAGAITIKPRGNNENAAKKFRFTGNKARLISAGASAGKYLHLGKPKSGTPIHYFETSNGEFILFDNGSLLVIDYVGALNSDISTDFCSNVETCRSHIQQCGIEIRSEYDIF
jgi:hypothetical protein